VDDVRAQLADQAREPERRERVADRRELARQARERHDLDVGLLGHERHRRLAAGDVPGHERRLVSPPREAAGEIGDVQRRAADVEPRDHSQHADRPAFAEHAHRGRD